MHFLNLSDLLSMKSLLHLKFIRWPGKPLIANRNGDILHTIFWPIKSFPIE
jgi:hypothetical protein